jgi:hypothetical protein
VVKFGDDKCSIHQLCNRHHVTNLQTKQISILVNNNEQVIIFFINPYYKMEAH